MADLKRAGESDIRKLIELVEKKLSIFDKSKLSLSGGVILSSIGNMLTLKRNDETGGAAIDFDNKKQGIIRILGSILDGAQQFSILDKTDGTTTFAVSKKLRQIFDYKTNTLKEILVKGEALPITGGRISDERKDVLYLRNSNKNGSSVSLRFDIPQHPNYTVMLTVFDNGMFEIWDSLNGESLLKASKDSILYKGEKILIEGDDVGNCVVNGKKLSELLS